MAGYCLRAIAVVFRFINYSVTTVIACRLCFVSAAKAEISEPEDHLNSLSIDFSLHFMSADRRLGAFSPKNRLGTAESFNPFVPRILSSTPEICWRASRRSTVNPVNDCDRVAREKAYMSPYIGRLVQRALRFERQ
jgi:hypothetical protein